MFEFLQTTEKKSAFKKALNEITHEKPEPIVFSEKRSVEGAPRRYSTTIKNPLRKPETTAVDLKNFKDWRQVDKVKSDNPVYKKPDPAPVPKPAPAPKAKDDDEDEIFERFPGGRTFAKDNPVTTAEVIDRFAVLPKDEPQTTTNRKVTLQELVNRFQSSHSEAPKKEPEKEKPAVKVKEEPVDKNIKVEIVDFSDKKPKAKTPSKRKPRGKSKKRFDADVISSVDWK